MRMWAIHHPNGSFEQVYDDKRPKVPGAKVVEIERMGDLAIDRHDPRLGWVPREAADQHRAIDAGYDIDHPQRRLIDQAVKEIEARIVLGLFPHQSRLAAEAALRGVSVEDLARSVLAKAEQNQPDLARVAAKLSIKG